LCGNINTGKKTTETLICAGKETGIEIKADKTQYIVMSRVQKAGQSNNINFDNTDFGKAKLFKYLGRNLMTKN
jgi:hypothetical protein